MAERILGIAKACGRCGWTGPIAELIKLTMLCMFLTHALLVGLYEKGLLRGAKPAPVRDAAVRDAAPERGAVPGVRRGGADER